jgi:hypothetical protein
MGASKKSILVLVSLVCCLCLTATHYASAQPINDECENATLVDVGSVTSGTTSGANIDGVAPCLISVTAPGVWYKVIGTGTEMTASTCNSFSNYDTKISVFCGDCGELLCINANDDSCSSPSGLLSTVSWCSQAGAEYLILVHGYGSATGNFELSVSADTVACTPQVQCIPAGACCFSDDGTCQNNLTRDLCEMAGGAYQGDDTLCQGEFVGYDDSPEECENEFEDISESGTEAPNASSFDDGGDVVPIGFEFIFYGDSHTEIGISSNGYLTFGPDRSDFSNDSIPFYDDPNDLIAPYWDDWSPNQGGTVHYQTLGTEPNRMFIAQWTNVPHYSNQGSSTFQAILFEGTNCIEFRYGSLTRVSPTVGIENQDGTDGISADPANVTQGTCVSFCPEFINPIECLEVSLDIKPGSCPNPINTKSQGVLPAAILGNENFHVSKVDPGTIRLEGVAPLRSSFEDVATPFVSVTGKWDCKEHCNELGPDGYTDLTLKFDTQELITALGEVEDGDCLVLNLTGNLLGDYGGSAFTAEDVVCILKKGKQNVGNQNKGEKGKGKK